MLENKWHVGNIYSSGRVSAARNVRLFEGDEQRRVFLHREILDPAPGKVVDHANCNPLDNRRPNLRECNAVENSRNRPTRRDREFKGVMKHRDKWRSRIRVDGKRISLGVFERQSEAAIAYDAAVRLYFGAFGVTNFGGA